MFKRIRRRRVNKLMNAAMETDNKGLLLSYLMSMPRVRPTYKIEYGGMGYDGVVIRMDDNFEVYVAELFVSDALKLAMKEVTERLEERGLI